MTTKTRLLPHPQRKNPPDRLQVAACAAPKPAWGRSNSCNLLKIDYNRTRIKRIVEEHN